MITKDLYVSIPDITTPSAKVRKAFEAVVQHQSNECLLISESGRCQPSLQCLHPAKSRLLYFQIMQFEKSLSVYFVRLHALVKRKQLARRYQLQHSPQHRISRRTIRNQPNSLVEILNSVATFDKYTW